MEVNKITRETGSCIVGECRRHVWDSVFLLLVVWLLPGGPGLADTMVIGADHTSAYVGKYLQYLEDPSGEIDLSVFLDRKQNSQLTNSEVDKPNFGYTPSTYWFSLELGNGASENKSLLLEFDYPQIDNIEVYYLSDGQEKKKQHLGDHEPFYTRPLDHRKILLPISLEPQEELTIVLKIKTNSSFKVGLILHDKDLFWQKDSKATIIQGVYFGIMLIMVLYNGFIYLTLKTRTYFWYVIYVLMFGAYQFCIQGYDYQYLWQYSPFLHEKGLPFSIGISGIGILHFSKSFLTVDETNPKVCLIIKFLGVAFIVGSALTFFIPYMISIRTQVLLVASTSFFLGGVALLRLHQGCADAKLYLLALFSFLAGAILYALGTLGVLPSVFLTDYGDQIGSALQVTLLSLALARRMKRLQEENTEIQKKAAEAAKAAADSLSKKNEEITFFNKNLERLVDEKTKEVRILLDYIPQGVLSLENSDGQIAKDYSAHLETILGHDKVSNTTFTQLILNHCQISADQKNLTEETIGAVVGEDSISFLMNSHNLARELIYMVDEEERILSVTWNVQLDDNDTVQRMLVTLMDVTSEKVLEREAAKQRQEMQKIEELLNVPAVKAGQFFATSLPLLQENFTIIEQIQGPIDQHLVRMLFVNAHTVKGGARTLGFKEIAASIHEAEDYYSQILKENVEVDVDKLKKDIRDCLSVFNIYVAINRDKLNRKDSYEKLSVDREFIESHYQILTAITNADHVSVKDIIDSLREQSESLTSLIFEQVAAIFNGYKEKANKIAKDLGKTSPKYNFDIDDISITPEAKVVLDNCMIHILRNILDHGIENSEQREAVGKEAQGLITITGKLKDGILKLHIEDDGRGLAISRLRKIGIEGGNISEQASLQEIAELIFESGSSTAQEISDISGRGVGMNAVRTFLERSNGSIDVVVNEPKDSKKEFYVFHFEISLPVQIDKEEEAA